VEHADYFDDPSGTDFVENQMATYRKNSIARTNKVTGFAKFRVISQAMERMVKFSQVTIPLFTAPSLFRVFGNPFQICPSGGFYPEPRH
jgi:hypothetical protein